MNDFQDDNECQCSRQHEEMTAYLLHRLKGDTADFQRRVPASVLELLTSSTAPLMSHFLKPRICTA